MPERAAHRRPEHSTGRDRRLVGGRHHATARGGLADEDRRRSTQAQEWLRQNPCFDGALGDFSNGEARSLVGRHTDETGHAIEDGAIAKLWRLSCGQPWLVNALAFEACSRNTAGRDRSWPITLRIVREACDRQIP